jgi:hypothetical protein
MSMPPSRYREKRVTVITCTTCDEEVIRLGGVTKSEADQAVYDHERARHAIPLPQDPPREAP